MTLPIWLTLFGAVCQAVTGDVTLITLGGYNLQGPELSLIGIGIFLTTNYHRLRLQRSFILLLTLALVLLTAIAIFRGIFENVAQATVAMRSVLVLPLLLAAYALICPDATFYRSVVKAILFFATVTSTIVFMRIVFGPQLFVRIYTSVAEINDGGRAMSAPGALLIAVSVVMLLAQVLEGTRKRSVNPKHVVLLSFLATALALTLQGTATLSALAGMAVVFAVAPGRGASLRFAVTSFAAICAGVSVVWAPELLSIDFYIGMLPDDLAFHLGRRTGNLDTRTQIWSGFLNSFETRDTIDQLLGLPAGARESILTTIQGGTYWNNSLHSGYMGMLSSTGTLGLTVFLLLFGAIAAACLSGIRSGGYPPPYLGLALVCLILTYGYGYDWRSEQAIYILLAMGAAVLPASKSAPAAVVQP